METSQALSIESFSHSWLTNRKFSFDSPSEPLRPSLDFSDEPYTSEETKYKIIPQNFNFDIPISKSPASIVHADEIFSNGQILPKYASNSVLSVPISSISLRPVCPSNRIHCHFLKKWRKSSAKILYKYLGFLRPLCLKVGCSRRSIRVDDIDRRVWEVKSWNSSPQASPPRNVENHADNWCDMKRKGDKNCDTDRGLRKAKSWTNSPQESPVRIPSYATSDWGVDSSIYEAILHCKRSYEK